jgi:hypothetical protein
VRGGERKTKRVCESEGEETKRGVERESERKGREIENGG